VVVVFKSGGKSKGPSNKPHKGPSSAEDHVEPKRPILHKPKIDKLSVVLPIENLQERDHVIHALNGMIMLGGPTGFYAPGTKKGGYKQSVRIHSYTKAGHPSKEFMLVQANPSNEKKAFMRCEWNPARLGPVGFAQMKHEMETEVLPNWLVKLISLGRVTRLDIAVDLRGTHMDDLIIRNKQSRAMTLITGTDGRTETIYFGKPKSNQLSAYDLVKKAKAKGLPIPKVPMTRIEKRWKNPGMVKELPNLKNPLSGITIYHPDPISYHGPKVGYESFRNLCQVRGVKRALEQQPYTMKKLTKPWLEAQRAKWWAPNALWSHWPTVLENAGLASKE